MATILVIDDRAASRETARAVLDHGGYTVIEASEGRQALTLARDSHPDVVLTDVLMPGMDGYQLVRELRSDPGTAGIPVLFYTANYREDEARPLAAAFGVSKILRKDASPQELLDSIAAALTAPAPAATAGTDFGVQHTETVTAKLLEKAQALDDSEARFAAMAEAAPIGIVIADLHGHATYVNPRLSEITRVADAELLGQGWQRCLSPARRQAIRASLSDVPASLDRQRHHERLTLPGGQQRRLNVLLQPVRHPEHGLTGLIAMIDDVTAETEAEERRLAEEREREAEARRQLNLRFDSLARLAGGVAHDFNNLLNIVMAYDDFVRQAIEEASGAILTDAQAEAVLSDIDQIYRAGQRAADITHQLLTFGGREVVTPVVTDINALIGEARNMIADAIGEHITVTTQLDQHLRPTLADPGQIRQVLLNLAANARDAMPAGGRLHIETANLSTGTTQPPAGLPSGEYVHIAITDTGHGMPAPVVQQAIEPFFTTKPPGQGSGGLGLATSYGVIKQAGGQLSIDSAPGCGTTIHLYLPATGDKPGPAERATAAPGPSGQTVLVADDEDGLRQLVTRMLTRAGYHVLTAPSGQEALRLAQRHDGVIHALVTDVVMPAMNGRELADELRRSRPDVAVLYMSGYAAPLMTEQGLLDPGVSLISKPFSQSGLLSALQVSLGQRAAESPPAPGGAAQPRIPGPSDAAAP
jgi:two-component system, cell cycle sensor histidine kinase and response regulator CckA